MNDDSARWHRILDYEKGTKIDLKGPKLLHAHAIDAHRYGLFDLATRMREFEQKYVDGSDFSLGGEAYPDFAVFHPVEYCLFNWFAISLTSYLRLVALVELVEQHHWTTMRDLMTHREKIDKYCDSFVSEVSPAVLQWRNKVAAHPAATQARSNKRETDKLGTLLQSFSCPVARMAGYMEVGREVWDIDGEVADVRPWSLTATYERLTARFWPEMSIRPLRYKPEEEPWDEPGTHLHAVRNAK